MNKKPTKTKKSVTFKTFIRRGLFCGVMIYICFCLISQQFQLSHLTKQEKELDNQLSIAQREAKELEAQKNVVGTDDYIERVARERLGFMKSYEKVFIDANK